MLRTILIAAALALAAYAEAGSDAMTRAEASQPPVTKAAVSNVPAFRPERFEFVIKWTRITVGSASMEIRKNDSGSYSIYMFAWSNNTIATLYPVQDVAESRFDDPAVPYPSLYKIITAEGKRKKNREVIFRRLEKKADSIDHLKGVSKEYDVPEHVFDPMTAFMFTRGKALGVAEIVRIPIFDGKKYAELDVKVIRRESIEVPAGKFDTLVIQPLIDEDSFFAKMGDMFIWLTDDARHVPVRVKTKVFIGSVSAELVGGVY